VDEETQRQRMLDLWQKLEERLNAGDLNDALEYCEALSEVMETLGEHHGRAMILNNQGLIYVQQERYDEAMVSFQQAHGLFMALGDRQGQGRQLENIGSVHRDMGQYEQAIEPYLEALKIFEEIEDHFGLANQYANVAYIHIMNRDPVTALEWFRMALPLYERIDHAERAGLTRKNIAELEKLIDN